MPQVFVRQWSGIPGKECYALITGYQALGAQTYPINRGPDVCRTRQKSGTPVTMKNNERREHLRTALNAKVSVTHEQFGKRIFATRDISDGGIFIVAEGDFEPAMGDRVIVQVQGLPIPAPELEMVVVRKTLDGYGLRFGEEFDS